MMKEIKVCPQTEKGKKAIAKQFNDSQKMRVQRMAANRLGIRRKLEQSQLIITIKNPMLQVQLQQNSFLQQIDESMESEGLKRGVDYLYFVDGVPE